MDRISSSQAANDAASAILKSAKLDEIWRSHYKRAGDENPAREFASEIDKNGLDLRAHPDDARFLVDFLDLEYKALGSPHLKDAPEISAARSDLANMKKYFLNQVDGKITAPRNKISEPRQKLLVALEKETVQTPSVARASWNGFKSMWVHIYEDAMKHKVGFASLLTVSIGGLTFMNSRLGSSSTVYLEPEISQVPSIDLNDLAANHPLSFDPSLARDIEPSCHDHLKQLFGENVADFAQNALTIGDTHLFPQHCSKVKNFAENAQSSLQGGYDWVNQRLAMFTKDRVLDIADKLPDSNFVHHFNEAAKWAAEGVYAFDSVENITIHTLLFISAAKFAHKRGTLESEQLQRNRDTMVDFFNRTVHKNYLGYLFGAAGASYAFATGDGVNPGMIWGGLAGTLSGNGIHCLVNRFRKKDHVLDVTHEGREKLQEFREAAGKILHRVPDDPAVVKKSKTGLKAKLTAAFATVVGTIGSLAYADMSGAKTAISSEALQDLFAKAVEYSADAAGVAMVWGTYLLVNVPQDVALHIIFALAGGTVGLSTAAAQRLAKRITKMVKGEPVGLEL